MRRTPSSPAAARTKTTNYDGSITFVVPYSRKHSSDARQTLSQSASKDLDFHLRHLGPATSVKHREESLVELLEQSATPEFADSLAQDGVMPSIVTSLDDCVSNEVWPCCLCAHCHIYRRVWPRMPRACSLCCPAPPPSCSTAPPCVCAGLLLVSRIDVGTGLLLRLTNCHASILCSQQGSFSTQASEASTARSLELTATLRTFITNHNIVLQDSAGVFDRHPVCIVARCVAATDAAPRSST